MGVYIPKMEMPKNCGECPCYYFEYKECNAIGGRMVFRNATPPTDCPLVELPPHGRLIDADAAIEDIRDEILERQMDGMKGTPLYIEDLRQMWQRLEDEDLVPTIIEAEEGINVPIKEGEA